MVTKSVGTLPVENALMGSLPCEGARVLAFIADFSLATEYDFDLSSQFNNGIFTTLQTAYIDNSLSGQPTSIFIPAVQQTLTCPPNSQGYFSLLMTNPPNFQFSSSGGVNVGIQLMNFYIPPTVWSAV